MYTTCIRILKNFKKIYTPLLTNSGSPTVNNSSALPTIQGEFGGFKVGESRNENATAYSNVSPNSYGWRVWDIDENTGEITLISAGNPETYYNANGNSGASMDILRNRDCSMYVNEEYATRAEILTGEEAATWYNKQFGTNFTISSIYNLAFSTSEPISVLENGSYYWLATSYNSDYLYLVFPNLRVINNASISDGFRCTLSSNIKTKRRNRQKQWRWN